MASIPGITGTTVPQIPTQPSFKLPGAPTPAEQLKEATESLADLRLEAAQGNLRAETKLALEQDLFGKPAKSSINLLA
ncbi:hypothetical protein [Geothrix sp. 21YS21S-2]|uniref:hypothetical protein n=1 Tax=Geothrix sp. 21YS21S-2 TaxID=3068893 RepID=UPI0027B88FBE|nr:hypothetical protein [Geothrix sp. 21YS21S-2]